MTKYTLNELCDFITDGTHQTPEYCENGGYIFLSSKDVTSRKIDWNHTKRIPEMLHEKLYERLSPQKNDILLAKNGTTGVAAIVDKDEVFDVYVSLAVLRPKKNVYPLFLYYAINSPIVRRQFDAGLKGIGVPNLHLNVIRQAKIQTPIYTKQIDICKTLSKIERIIENLKEELVLFDNLVKARFVEMFGTADNNAKGWIIKTIGDCCTLKSGTSLPAELENEGGEIPYVKVGDMNYPGNERYITTSSRYVTAETAGKGIFPVGSILFPKRGGAIGTNKKRMTTLPICADLNVMGVSSNGELLPEYLMVYFEMTDLGALDNGSSVPQINNKDIAPLRICVPPLSIQEEFKDFVTQIDKSKFAVQRALDKVQLLFDSLMQKYFG